jgi:uncharacterized membrane protein (UPF0127 family)
MSYVELANLTRGCVLGARIAVADRWWSRLRGLLGRPAIGAGEGLVLTPCRAVHTLGMSYPVDVAFVDRRGAVVAVYNRLAPGHRSCRHKTAAYALELPAGTLARCGTREGDTLAWRHCRPISNPGAPAVLSRRAQQAEEQ